jgi:hypothetical protein
MRRFLFLCLGIVALNLTATGPAWSQKKAKIEDLLKELDSKNSAAVRATALREIGELAAVKLVWAKMALPQMREILDKEKDATLRSAALVCLAKTEADVPKFVPNMMKYLKEDKDYGVQNTALAQIAGYAQDAAPAIAPLQEHLLALREANKDQDPGNIRSGILNTIVQIDQNLSQPSSLEAIEKDPAISVKLTAIGRLTQIAQNNGAKGTAPLLIKVYDESLKAGPNADLRRGILGALAFIEPNSKSYMPQLIETLKKDKDAPTVVVVIAALGRGGDSAKEAIPLVLDAQKKALAGAPKDGSDPNGQRRIIVESIVKMGIEPKELVPVLVDTLKKDREPGVRAATLVGLAGIGKDAKEALPTLAAMAKANTAVGAKDGNDPADLRRTTLEALAKVGPEPKELVTLLTDAVRRDRNPAVRLTAVKALGDVGPGAKSALTLLTSLQKIPKTAGEPEKALAKAAAEAAEKIQGK